jgi:hypothetical protein
VTVKDDELVIRAWVECPECLAKGEAGKDSLLIRVLVATGSDRSRSVPQELVDAIRNHLGIN